MRQSVRTSIVASSFFLTASPSVTLALVWSRVLVSSRISRIRQYAFVYISRISYFHEKGNLNI